MRFFRVAPEAPRARHVAATLAQMTLFWTTFLGLLPWAIHTATRHHGLAPVSFPGHAPLGIALFTLASTLGLGSALTMSLHGRGTPLPLRTARDLVVAGPYRHLRNPMALAGITQGVAVGLFLADWVVVGYALAGAVLWHRVARPPEERDLLARFGEPYRRYRDAVPLWLPRPRPFRDSAQTCGQKATKSCSNAP